MILEASWDNLYSLSFGLSQCSTQVMLIFLHKNNCDPTSMIINHIFKGFFEAHKLGLGTHVSRPLLLRVVTKLDVVVHACARGASQLGIVRCPCFGALGSTPCDHVT